MLLSTPANSTRETQFGAVFCCKHVNSRFETDNFTMAQLKMSTIFKSDNSVLGRTLSENTKINPVPVCSTKFNSQPKPCV